MSERIQELLEFRKNKTIQLREKATNNRVKTRHRQAEV
jgi:hypothetical protein